MIYLTAGQNEIFPHVAAWRERESDAMRLRILISYWYYKDTDLDALFEKYFTPPYPDVFADSGGFSAMTQGIEINIKEYADWVKRFKHLFATYANLDAIGSATETLNNQKQLEDMGLNPLPVFHTGEKWDVLDYYIENYQYIALGGMVPYMRYPKKIMPWLIQAYKHAAGRSVFHGFGATSWVVVTSFPWYSVDSSSWGSGFRYGQVPLFDEKRGRFAEAKLGDPISCRKNAELIIRLGFDPLDFADRSRNDRAKICAISALSYIKSEQWLRKRWGEIHIPTKTNNDGLRLLSDTSNGINYGDADKGIKFHLADARGNSGGDLAAADVGLKIHLAEHSLDRGGIGDTSRAMQHINRATGINNS